MKEVIKIETIKIAYAYYRLSREEVNQGESSSITNQRSIVERYCHENNIALANEFVDDGYSGSNFDRPGFQKMIEEIEKHPEVNMIITKDLSRLGRNMSESSYYAETFFPEKGIRGPACYPVRFSLKKIILPAQAEARNRAWWSRCTVRLTQRARLAALFPLIIIRRSTLLRGCG